MGLGIVTSSGDFIPYVKYNAKAGRWYRKGESGEVEVEKPVFVADFANIKTGWFYFAAGQAPDRVFDAKIGDFAPKPSDEHKRGFCMNLFSQNSFDGVAELSSTSQAMCGKINELYEQYEAAPESKQGKLPVIAFIRAHAVNGQHGTNYEPEFELQKWVDRPAELDEGAAAPTQSATVDTTPSDPPVAAGSSEF